MYPLSHAVTIYFNLFHAGVWLMGTRGIRNSNKSLLTSLRLKILCLGCVGAKECKSETLHQCCTLFNVVISRRCVVDDSRSADWRSVFKGSRWLNASTCSCTADIIIINSLMFKGHKTQTALWRRVSYTGWRTVAKWV